MALARYGSESRARRDDQGNRIQAALEGFTSSDPRREDVDRCEVSPPLRGSQAAHLLDPKRSDGIGGAWRAPRAIVATEVEPDLAPFQLQARLEGFPGLRLEAAEQGALAPFEQRLGGADSDRLAG